MGNRVGGAANVGAGSSSRTSTAEESTATPSTLRTKPLKEKSRHGVVSVDIMTQMAATRGRVPRTDQPQSHVITSRGSIIHGSQCDPSTIQRGKISTGECRISAGSQAQKRRPGAHI